MKRAHALPRLSREAYTLGAHGRLARGDKSVAAKEVEEEKPRVQCIAADDLLCDEEDVGYIKHAGGKSCGGWDMARGGWRKGF